jgi:septum formation protein
MRLILASTSPRRKALLETLGLAFDIIAPRYEEVLTANLTPEQQVVVFALGKARSIGILDAFILGSDTLVVVDNLILGKPVDVSDARRMLTLLRGRTHRVVTGVALIVPGGAETTWYEVTEVRMRKMTDEQIAWYLSTQEPFDKAGAYAIQGIGGKFIEQVNGNIDNVVGLPLQSVATALQRYGFAVSLRREDSAPA